MFFEVTVRLRYPWFTRELGNQIKNADPKTDDALMDLLFGTIIDWHLIYDYGQERQHLADRSGLQYISPKIKLYEIVEAIFSNLLRYRVHLTTLTSRDLNLERLRLNNAKWKVISQERRDSDPLLDLRRPRYADWLAKPKWTREQFACLALRIDPAAFDERRFELAAPYSVIGSKALHLLRKLDAAIAQREVSFPSSPKALRNWAYECGITLPNSILPKSVRKSQPVHVSSASSSLKRAIRDAVQQIAIDRRFTVTKDRLRDLIEDVVGEKRISENAYNREIWAELPSKVKKNGKPNAAWLITWSENIRHLRDAVELANRASKPLS